MFSLFFHSFPRKGRLPVLVSPLVLFVLCLLAGTVLFTGCSWGGNPAVIEGTWVNPQFTFETYTITDTTFTADGADYEGTIVNVISDGAGAGYIIIQFTRNGWTPTAVGNYYVIHYKNLTASTVDISGSSDSNGKTTQAEAEAEYTVANGYFTTFPYSSCTRKS
jgi:hypothetical protein